MMNQKFTLEVPKATLSLLNQLYEIEKKLMLHGDKGNAMRNIGKIKEVFAESRFFYEDPMGQAFNDTRTDLDVNISGSGTEDLVVVEVIKPIIRCGDSAFSKVVQKGIVIVESQDGGTSQ